MKKIKLKHRQIEKQGNQVRYTGTGKGIEFVFNSTGFRINDGELYNVRLWINNKNRSKIFDFPVDKGGYLKDWTVYSNSIVIIDSLNNEITYKLPKKITLRDTVYTYHINSDEFLKVTGGIPSQLYDIYESDY